MSASEPDLAPLLRRHDRDRFLASLFAPAGRREALWALIAFNFEIARVRETVSQPLLGRIRLQWWREMLDEAYGDGAVRRHEVATPLAGAIRTWRIGRASLDAMIDGRERDLEEGPLADLAALDAYAEATSGRLNEAMLDVLGVAGEPARIAARRVGIAWAIAGLIRAERYRPQPFLPPDGIGLVDSARRHLAAARALRRQVPRAALPALLTAPLADAYLSRAGRPDAAAPDPLAALRLAWAKALGRY